MPEEPNMTPQELAEFIHEMKVRAATADKRQTGIVRGANGRGKKADKKKRQGGRKASGKSA